MTTLLVEYTGTIDFFPTSGIAVYPEYPILSSLKDIVKLTAYIEEDRGLDKGSLILVGWRRLEEERRYKLDLIDTVTWIVIGSTAIGSCAFIWHFIMKPIIDFLK